jgi:DNA (cytosine-5)-methyltransferase 1
MVRKPRDFERYVKEWDGLGWRVQAVCANSAIWGAAPQSRDRLYLLVTRKSVPVPDTEFRPACRCLRCECDVLGVQTWKAKALKRATSAGPVGKYGPKYGQYFYRCPLCGTRSTPTVVAPYIIPAEKAIDWQLRGIRIGDRDEPLVPATMRRIEVGLLRHYAEHLVRLSRLNDRERDQPVPMWLPYPALTAGQEFEIGSPPVDAMQLTLRNDLDSAPIDGPWRTVCGSGNHHALLAPPPGVLVQAAGHTYERPGYARAWSADLPSPVISGTLDKAIVTPPDAFLSGEAFAVANFGTERGGHVRDVTEQPIGTLTGGGQYGITQQSVLRVPHEAVIASYYGGSTVTTDASRYPFRTQTGVDRHALIEPPLNASHTRVNSIERLPYPVEDAEFRMVVPEECARMMGIHQRLVPLPGGGYKIVPYKLSGTKGDRVRLAGNSLTPGVEAELLDRALTAQGV